MNKHVLIFLAFNNVDDIKKSFESMYLPDIDYFIIENKSGYSEEIKNYFLEQKKTKDNIVKYIQYEKNIAAVAVNIAIRDYADFFKQYDYITFTDGDYFIYDMDTTIKEMLSAFDDGNCGISSVSLYTRNNWRQGANRVIGSDHYVEFMKQRENQAPAPKIGIGVPCIMTLQKKDFGIFEKIYFLDGNIRGRVSSLGKSWYITTKCLSYHLTCDLYIDEHRGNDYANWKRSLGKAVWTGTEEASYEELIK